MTMMLCSSSHRTRKGKAQFSWSRSERASDLTSITCQVPQSDVSDSILESSLRARFDKSGRPPGPLFFLDSNRSCALCRTSLSEVTGITPLWPTSHDNQKRSECTSSCQVGHGGKGHSQHHCRAL